MGGCGGGGEVVGRLKDSQLAVSLLLPLLSPVLTLLMLLLARMPGRILSSDCYSSPGN